MSFPPSIPFAPQPKASEPTPQGAGPEITPDNLPRNPDLTIRGFQGYYRYHGLIYEEYQQDLQGIKKVDIYRKMRSDGTVAALFSALTLPIQGASWVIEPGGTDSKATKAAELVEDNLFNRLGASWEEEVRKLLTHLQFGFQLSVTNWAVDAGDVVLRELRPLHPRTILMGLRRWEFDPKTHELVGVWQWGTDGEQWREEFIPGTQLLRLTHDSEFDNPEGTSILRPGYKHWWLCDQYYHFEAIGHERGAVGVPVGTYPKGASLQRQDDLLALCQGIQSHEQAGAILEDGYVISNFHVESKGDGKPLLDSIHHHKTELAKSVLAQFLQLGQEGSKGGAYALSADQSDLFLKSLQAHADYICSRVNRVLIPQMVRYNVDTDQYPKLSATIATKDANTLAAAIVPLIVNGALTIGEGDEDWIRELFQMPPRELPRALPVQPVGVGGAGGQGGQNAPPAGAGEETGPARQGPPEPQQAPANGNGKVAAVRSREHLVILADPPSFRAEQPSYPALGRQIDSFKSDLRGLLDTLRARVWMIAGLPELEAEDTASLWVRDNRGMRRRIPARSFKGWGGLSEAQTQALDEAIGTFLTDYAGPDRSLRGFVGTDAEDALLQGNLRLGHAVGVNRAVELTAAERAASRPTRESPEIQKLLSDAFKRLSDQGQLRIGKQLGDIKTILIQGQTEGASPLDVAQQLSARFDTYESYEFERLARTEMSFAANGGALDEYRAQGVQQVQWLASGLACDICSALDGTIVDANEAVEGDNMPPGHPNCMCSCVPVTEDD